MTTDRTRPDVNSLHVFSRYINDSNVHVQTAACFEEHERESGGGRIRENLQRKFIRDCIDMRRSLREAEIVAHFRTDEKIVFHCTANAVCTTPVVYLEYQIHGIGRIGRCVIPNVRGSELAGFSCHQSERVRELANRKVGSLANPDTVDRGDFRSSLLQSDR